MTRENYAISYSTSLVTSSLALVLSAICCVLNFCNPNAQYTAKSFRRRSSARLKTSVPESPAFLFLTNWQTPIKRRTKAVCIFYWNYCHINFTRFRDVIVRSILTLLKKHFMVWSFWKKYRCKLWICTYDVIFLFAYHRYADKTCCLQNLVLG